MAVKQWTQPDSKHFRGLCANEFWPVVGMNGAGGCNICIRPVAVPEQKPCYKCDSGIVPSTFQLFASVPDYPQVDTTQSVTYSRNYISRLDGASETASTTWTSNLLQSETGSGNWTLVKDPGLYCTPFERTGYLRQSENPCAVRLFGKFQVRIKVVRAATWANNGSSVTWVRPTVPAFTDRGFPINTIQDPGEFADLGPWEFSVDENSSHLHSFFAEGISASTNFQGLGSTYIMPNGANSCRFVFGNGYGPPVPPPWDPPFISNSPFYDTYKSALDNVINKFTQFNAGYAFVEHHVTGFLWVLKLYGPNSGISGSLELFRRHSVQYQMSHVGPTAPSERANTNPTAPWPTGIPANALQYRILPQFRPIDRAGLPDIYLFAPLSMHSMPVLAFSYPVGNRETLAGGRFSYFSFPLFNFDPQLQGLQFLRFLRGAGSFTSPCSKREANVSMLFGDGQSGTVKLRW